MSQKMCHHTMNNPSDSDHDNTPALVPLHAIEARIVGCLIEKQATTPDAYPMTLNAIVVACNQKTSRDPVLDLEPGAVGHCLRELEGRGLVGASLGARSTRYEHRFDSYFEVTPRQRALLAMLLLRGPQTVNELYTRCERLADFPDADEVRVQLERLAQRDEPLVVCVGHASGQREDRHMHLLCGSELANERSASIATADGSASQPTELVDLGERVEALEQDVANLNDAVEEIRSQQPDSD